MSCVLKIIKYISRDSYLRWNRIALRYVSTGINDSNNDWDIVISGGGLVGSATAAALGFAKVLSNKKILLLETSSALKYSSLTEKYSNRVFALTPGTKDLLESFNAWTIIENLRFKEVKRLQIWESCSNATISFQQPELQSDVAYIVENEIILQALTKRLEAIKERVKIYYNAKVVNISLPKLQNIEWAEDWVTIDLEDGRQIRTKLLIGADGMNSFIRKTMNVRYIHWNYNQTAIVATLKLSEECENNVAWQRFLSTGPVAILPLTNSLSSLVWSTTPTMAHKLMNMSNEEFVNELNIALWDDIKINSTVESVLADMNSLLSKLCPAKGSLRQLPPNIVDVEEASRATFPLGFGHAAEYVASRVALIGDAAHRIHPMAGQGVNLGFGDVQCLVKVLCDCASIGGDIGKLNTLLKYETQRQKHIIPTMIAIEGLHRLYSTDWLPFVLLRSMGLVLIDNMQPIKEQITAHASS